MKTKFFIVVLLLSDIALILGILIHGVSIPVLNPAGPIALQEKNLMITATLLMLIVVIPVFALTIFIIFRYREGNSNAKYSPNWDHNRNLELLWWAIPCAIIIVLGIFAWTSSHALDPYKPISSNKQPIPIQVVALNWKWLFIYPQQHIASVNLVEFPENTPVSFSITSETVMNSFWIPALSGQIYAMPGMSTQLHLMANKTGDFYGSSANISGKGFARMTFTARAVTPQQFTQWIRMVKQSNQSLTNTTYQRLTQPSESNPVSYYSSVTQNLYNGIVMKYMKPKINLPE